MKNLNPILIKLEELRNKGAVWQTQHKAQKIILELEEMLTEKEYLKLIIARSHYINGDGAEELYDTIKEIKNNYT